jgi:DnaK suppressor protein
MDQRQPDDELDLEEVRRQLLERLAELRSREAELKRPPAPGSTIGFGKRIGEGTTEAIGRLTDVGVAEGLGHIEARILRALEKLDEGTYGTCDACGEPIPVPRLRIAPESALCVDCARKSRR